MGGGSKSTTTNEYMPEDRDLRRMGADYAREWGGGGDFRGQSPYADVSPWEAQTRDDYYRKLQQNEPMGAKEWMDFVQRSISENPAADYNRIQGMTPTAEGYNDPGVRDAMNMTMEYGGPGSGGVYQNTPQGVAAYDPATAVAAATNYMNKVVAPQVANSGVAGGSNPMSGAYAEAATNAASGMAVDINKDVMAGQRGWYEPQLHGAVQGGLNKQNASNQILGMGYQGAITGEHNRQGATNQFRGNAQNAGYQGLMQQGQNKYNAAMQTPQGLNQINQGINENYGARQGLSGMDAARAREDYMRRQALYSQVVSGMYGGGGMSPISQTTNMGGGGFNTGGALGGMGGGAAMGAMAGSAVGGIGALPGAAIGGLGGLFSGGFCWIADALYGPDTEEAQAARAWVSEGWQGEEADEFRVWYTENGPTVAKALAEDDDFIRSAEHIYRELFDEFVVLGRGYLAHAA